MSVKGYMAATLGCLSVIAARITYLQLGQADYYRTLSERNCTRMKVIPSLRGTIFDARGRPLATNRPFQNLLWSPIATPLQSDQRQALNDLVQHLDLAPRIQELLGTPERLKKPLELKKNLTDTQRAFAIEARILLPHLQLNTTVARWYPAYTLACHALGYMSVDQEQAHGKIGLERVCDEQLQGSPGSDLVTINAQGTPCAHQLIAQARAGQTMVTCLDYDLCTAAAAAFPAQESGCILLMQAHTGHLQVALSWPTFDPHVFLEPLSESTWKELTTSGALFNRYTQACYPPASLFKLVTLTAALEMGVCTAHDTWYCPGKMHYCGRDYHCANRRGHGHVSVPLALGVSCNIPFFDMAQRLKIDTIAEYAQAFGLGAPTGCILPEKRGLVPSRAWKKKVFNEPWWPGETLSVAVGQGALLITPLQVLNILHSIMHGYRVTPRLLQDEPLQTYPVPIATSTREFLQQCLKRTVEKRGTGSSLSKLQHMTIYAKTGTSQVSSYHLRELGKQFLEHAWFTAHVTYKDHPPVILVVLVEHMGSSSVAANVALNFLKSYADIQDQRV